MRKRHFRPRASFGRLRRAHVRALGVIVAPAWQVRGVGRALIARRYVDALTMARLHPDPPAIAGEGRDA